MKYLILTYISIAFLFSCEKVLDLDTDIKKSKLVVNSLFNEDTTINIRVENSLSILDNGILENIYNAKVQLYDEADNFIERIPYNQIEKGFLSTTKPIAGKSYTVRVDAVNFESVTATSVCPVKVPIVSFDTLSIPTNYGPVEKTVTITFDDPSIENYYAIGVNEARYERVFDTNTLQWDTSLIVLEEMFLTSNSPVIDNSGFENYSTVLTLKDNLFNGQRKSITFKYLSNYYPGSPDIFKTTISLSSLTKDSYNYTKSIESYQNNEGNPFAEPVQVYSNVENGFGIFAGKSIYELVF